MFFGMLDRQQPFSKKLFEETILCRCETF